MPILKLKSLRNRMIRDDKVRKYFLYAFGEIVLVIAGILIALQINGWNDGRKQTERMNQLKQSVKEELEANLTTLRSEIADTKEFIGSCNYLLTHMNHEEFTEQQTDSLVSSVMGYVIWRPNTFALDEMVNTGSYSTIEEPEVKKTINRYRAQVQDLEEHLGFLDHQAIQLMDCVSRNGSGLNTVQHFPFIGADRSQIANNLSIFTNPEFENRLSIKLISMNFVLREYEQTAAVIEELIQALSPSNAP